MKREIFKSFDGAEINIAVWDGAAAPIGVVQIVHGMAEHIARYDGFAKFLNENGIICAGGDHRGHGLTANGAYGKYSAGDIARDTLRDQIALTDMLKSRYNLPVIVFGHSYGSFLTQGYILEPAPDRSPTAGRPAAYVLSGSAYMGGLLPAFGRMMADGKVRRGKADEDGKTFAKMTFESYDKKLRAGKNAWLSRDAAECEKYNADPMCGFICSNGFYKSFFALLKSTTNRRALSLVDKNVKIHIVSGGRDAVGGYGKLVGKLAGNYEKRGFKNVTHKIYDGYRHEILNETGRETVYGDLLNYFQKIFH